MKKIKTKISIWAFVLRAGLLVSGPSLTIIIIVAMIIKGFSIDVFVFCIGTLIVTIVLYYCIIIQNVHFDIKKQKVKVRHMRWDYNCEIPFAQIAYIEAKMGNIIFTYKSGGKKEILLFRPWMTIKGKKVIQSWNEYLKENINKK